MVKVSDSVKNHMFETLHVCLTKLSGYEVDSIIPLFYVLCAIHEGHLVSIISKDRNQLFKQGERYIQPVEAVDGYESDLLRSIRSSVDKRYFEGVAAEIIFDFCVKFDQDFLRENYRDLIEYIISYYTKSSGKYSGILVTPENVSHLMAAIVQKIGAKKVYDPFAGLCSFALFPEMENVKFYGQEISPIIKIIADIRINAAGNDAICAVGDSTQNWMSNVSDCDCIASELPLGLMLPEQFRPIRMIDSFVLDKFINTESIRKAVLLTASGVCFRGSYESHLRKELVSNNFVDTVISLPSGILSYTGVNCVILVLDKDKSNTDVRFVYANDCIASGVQSLRKPLDFNEVLNRLASNNETQSCVVSLNEIQNKDCNLTPSAYIQERIEVQQGQVLMQFMSLVKSVRGQRNYDETKGVILQPNNMFSSLAELHTKENALTETEFGNSRYAKICEPCIIFNVRADKFYLKKNSSPLFVSPEYRCFVVNPQLCIDEYLIYAIISSPKFKEQAYRGAGMPRIDYNNLVLPIYPSLESQQNIVNRVYREEQRLLQEKLAKLQVLNGRSSDLIHNLGVTFTRMSASIGKLMSSCKDENLNILSDNLRYALRLVNSTGTDFTVVNPELSRVNLFDELNKYIQGWRNYGFGTFEISPIKFTSVSEDTKIMLDTELFYIALDCILTNAHQHGFNKRFDEQNKVIVEVKGVIVQNEEYAMVSISNNGKPIPDGFSAQDFTSRGIVGINSSQDGLGGHHIYEIMKHHNGKLSIESDSDWVTINLLFPIYITSNESKFEEYEHECI